MFLFKRRLLTHHHKPFNTLFKHFLKGCPLVVLLGCCSFLPVLGQDGDIRGFLLDKNSGEPIIYANVYLEGTTYGATTDINGFFSISNVPAGSYVLIGTYLGYDTARVHIQLEPGQIITQRLFIEERTIALQSVEISAEKEEREKDVRISTTKISTKEIEMLPSVGGEADIAQYLQVLPGVVFTGDQGGQIIIRGGPPIQTKMLLDGVTIYNPFHSIGLFSVVETDFIKNVEVMTGGFNAEYGGRISAIVDITTKDGNKKRFSGNVSANPFIAKALLEGPIIKLKENGSSASFLLSFKNSYLDKSSKVFYEYIDKDGIPYSFTDYYGKFSFNATSGSQFSFFTMHNRDRVHYQGVSDYQWQQTAVGARFLVVPGQSNTLLSGNFAFSDYGVELEEADQKPRTSSVRGFNLGMDFTYFLPQGEIKYGVDINGFKTTFEFFNPLGLKLDQNQNTTELGVYFKYKKSFSRLVFEPSLRIQYYASLSDFSFEPRLGLKYNLTGWLRFKLAGGLYSQNLISTRSDRDVVNLFTGFLSGPEESLPDKDGNPAKHNLQKSQHAIFGVEADLFNHLQLNIEPYYIRFNQLININRNKQFASDPDYMIETGKAYGIDMLATWKFKNLYIWLTYSLAYVKRDDGTQVYPPHFDRRHNINSLIAYTFGKKKNYEASVRWNLGSGFPFTQTQGFYEDISFLDGLDTDYITANGDLGIIYAEELNGGRLPYYHRLDLAVKARYTFEKHLELELTASCTNVYNRENIFYFDRVRFERVNQLPILPALGVAFKF